MAEFRNPAVRTARPLTTSKKLRSAQRDLIYLVPGMGRVASLFPLVVQMPITAGAGANMRAEKAIQAEFQREGRLPLLLQPLCRTCARQ